MPRPHIQHWEDECLYVIEGVFEFTEEGDTFLAGPGSLVYVTKGSLHAYRNAGEAAGRPPVTQTPGGMHERFFEGWEAVERRGCGQRHARPRRARRHGGEVRHRDDDPSLEQAVGRGKRRPEERTR